MVANTLQESEESVAVLRFNPWLFRGTTELVTRFFEELSAQIGEGKFDGLKDVANFLAGMGRLLAPHVGVPGVSIAADAVGHATNKITQQKSLFSERKHLSDALAKAELRIVVLIDDIDRLEPAETRELMRLVRLTSDLPFLVFLLAFDRKHVARSFDEIGTDGQLYLDKIVQVGYDLPAVRETVIPNVFLAELERVVKGHDVAQIDEEVWRRVFYEVISPLLQNLRDVKRYLYSLPVTLDMIGQEVALADLLALEAVRILRPALFEDLKDQSECLVRYNSDVRAIARDPSRLEEIRAALAEMSVNAGGDQGVLKSLLTILFPVTHEFLNLGYVGEGNSGYSLWRQQRRVACEEVLRIYLSAGLAENVIPTRGIEELVESLANEERLTQLLKQFDEQQLEQALERLADFEEAFPAEGAAVAIPIFVNCMGNLSNDMGGFFGIPPRYKVTPVVFGIMNRAGGREVLSAKIEEILGKVESLSGKLLLVELAGHRETGGRKLVGEDRARELERQLVAMLTSATAAELENEWDLVGLCIRPIRWFEDPNKSRLSSRLGEHLDKDSFVLSLLRSSAGFSYFSTGHKAKRLPWPSLLESFGSDLSKAVDRLANSESFYDLGEDDQDTIRLAQKYAAGEEPNDE